MPEPSTNPTPTRKQIGREIRRARLAAGLTQIQLGAKIQVAQSDLSKMERGHRYQSVEVLSRVARAVGVPFVGNGQTIVFAEPVEPARAK